MNPNLQKILRKVEAVQLGLLRVENKNRKMLLQARAGTNEDLLNCIVSEPDHGKIQFGKVSLIQKDKEDYLYITCKVREHARRNQAVIMSMEILKACWFTRRSRGGVSWLQQKCTYEKAC
jgi:hypothetical protein